MYASNSDLKLEARQVIQRRQTISFLKSLMPFGKSNNLKSFEQALQQLPNKSRVDKGVQLISVDKIVGSVSDNQNFDADFHPRSTASSPRWVGLYVGFLNSSAIPPIEVYQIGEAYFVVDGHHRVSVARTIGQLSIEASVVQFG